MHVIVVPDQCKHSPDHAAASKTIPHCIHALLVAQFHVAQKCAIHDKEWNLEQLRRTVECEQPWPVRNTGSSAKTHALSEADATVISEPASFPMDPRLRAPPQIVLTSSQRASPHGFSKNLNFAPQFFRRAECFVSRLHATLHLILIQPCNEISNLSMTRIVTAVVSRGLTRFPVDGRIQIAAEGKCHNLA